MVESCRIHSIILLWNVSESLDLIPPSSETSRFLRMSNMEKKKHNITMWIEWHCVICTYHLHSFERNPELQKLLNQNDSVFCAKKTGFSHVLNVSELEFNRFLMNHFHDFSMCDWYRWIALPINFCEWFDSTACKTFSNQSLDVETESKVFPSAVIFARSWINKFTYSLFLNWKSWF